MTSGTSSGGWPADGMHVLLAQENERLRKRLSGALQHLEEAREGLANYAQEIERLKTELLEVNKALGLPRETGSNVERVKAALRLRLAQPQSAEHK